MTWFWQAWVAALVFVFPIPHTIALSNMLLLLGIVALLWACRQTLPRLVAWLKPAAWWLLALTAWIVFHSVAVASAPTLALDQFRANWLMPLLIGAIGAWAAMQLPRGRAAQAVAVALAVHMLWLLGWQLKLFLVTGAWPFKATPFAAYDYQGTLNSFLLALLVADRLAWALEKYSPLALGSCAGWALLFLSAVSDLALQSRNSTAVSIMLLAAASLVLLNVRSRHWPVIVVATGVVALLGLSSLSFDGRWQGLRESLVVGWSSPSTYWLTGDATTRPVTPSGAVLEESAYARAAWAHQAIDLIAGHPLGIGFGHDAFGRAVARKYGKAGFGSSHSGWLDFALGTGLAGLGLLLATAIVILGSAWKRFRQRQDAAALVLAFFVGGYTLRCLLDGHFSGWRLGLFAFICGVLIAGMREEPKAR
ncbi:MAG: O-antigen ligase family protein [Sulfuritalea sp.]|jgi:hypothetical protein|nr:O-antigen ligase family protein [Sulfuritalea sp.]